MYPEKTDWRTHPGLGQYQAHRACRPLIRGPVRSTLCFVHFLKNLSIQEACFTSSFCTFPGKTPVSRTHGHFQSRSFSSIISVIFASFSCRTIHCFTCIPLITYNQFISIKKCIMIFCHICTLLCIFDDAIIVAIEKKQVAYEATCSFILFA